MTGTDGVTRIHIKKEKKVIMSLVRVLHHNKIWVSFEAVEIVCRCVNLKKIGVGVICIRHSLW